MDEVRLRLGRAYQRVNSLPATPAESAAASGAGSSASAQLTENARAGIAYMAPHRRGSQGDLPASELREEASIARALEIRRAEVNLERLRAESESIERRSSAGQSHAPTVERDVVLVARGRESADQEADRRFCDAAGRQEDACRSREPILARGAPTAGQMIETEGRDPDRRLRYANLPEIKMPARFVGRPGEGPTMRNYLMQIDNARYYWEMDRLHPEAFFRGLSGTVAGPAETFYRHNRLEILAAHRERDSQDWTIVTEFMTRLQKQFPVQTTDRIQEFACFKRGRSESLLDYYGRLLELATDMECREEWRLVAKFMAGLEDTFQQGLVPRVYDMGMEAKVADVYALACRHEMAARMHAMEKASFQGAEKKRAAWTAATGEGHSASLPARGAAASTPATASERWTDRRKCHRCGEPGHLEKDCTKPATCDRCGQEGHLKRECPTIPSCSRCGRRGHTVETCYAKAAAQPVGGEEQEIEEQMARLMRRKESLKGQAKATRAMLAQEEEESEEGSDSEASFALCAYRHEEEPEKGEAAWMAKPVVQAEEEEPRDPWGQTLQDQRGSRVVTREMDAELEDPAGRHPMDRQVAEATVLVVGKGAISVGGIMVEQAVIDTGAHYVLLGKGLAERLQLFKENRLKQQGVQLMTTEGGAPKWMPITREAVTITLLPGEKRETRVHLLCGVSESEDFDVLLGMQLLYKIGATICMWQETVVYRAHYWTEGGPRGVLPVRFIRRQPKRAYQARARPLQQQLGEWTEQERDEEAEEHRNRGGMQGWGKQIPWYVTNLNTAREPIVLMELCGGIGTGLAGALEAGWIVKRWIHVEKVPYLRKIALHHASVLRKAFPGQLLPGAEDGPWTHAVHDVSKITEAHIEEWGRIDVLIAGWECQGVSRAGKGRGFRDERTRVYHDIIRAMKMIHEKQGKYLYLLENLDFALDPRELVREVHNTVTAELGAGVVIDAAQLGARAHRVRRYWQNGVTDPRLQLELSKTRRSSPRLVDAILEERRVSQEVQREDHPAHYPCNIPGTRREALPTIVASGGSWAYRSGTRGCRPGPGAIWNARSKEWEEPTANERELAMGFMPGATAAPGMPEWARRMALGGAMDVHAIDWILHTIDAHLLEKKLARERARVREAEATGMGLPGAVEVVEAQITALEQAEERISKEGWPEGVYKGDEDLARRGGRISRNIARGQGAEFLLMAREREPEASAEEKQWEVGAAMGTESQALQQVLQENRGAFSYTMEELGKCNKHELRIPLTSTVPTYQRRRRMSPEDEGICTEKCKELLAQGLIRWSESEYAAATVVASRTDVTGGVLAKRMCGDYRELNKLTTADRYPMPTADEIFDKLEGARVFSTLDLHQGFNQIPIREEDKKKTAFHGADGLYEWQFMPFGLRNASAIFQRVMDAVLRGIPAAACYIDNVIIFSKTPQEHVQDVKAALEAIKGAGMTCHPDKCRFGTSTVQYLGFEVEGSKLSIQKAKVEVLDRIGKPKDRSGLRAILGFLNYYRKFVPNFSKRAAGLNKLLREDQKWEWGVEQEAALRDLMEAVKVGPVLTLPSRDKPFTVYSDWSSIGIGAVLAQGEGAEERVVAFASRSCNAAESNYSLYAGEGLAAVWAIEHFKAYLQGRHFTLVTDHQPLTWLMTNHSLTGRNARWAVRLQEYDFTIKHRPGKTLQHVDGLSRHPPPETASACLMALAVGADEQGAMAERSRGAADIWQDLETLQWVKGEIGGADPVSVRARGRVAHYRWYQEQIQIQTKEGWKLVPRPEERASIIEKVHQELGHYGHSRTQNLVETGWWWAGMRQQIKEAVSQCEICSKNKAHLDQSKQELHSLPILGLGFRWSLDIAGELPTSSGGKRYVLIMIEHVSKWVEVRALSSKSSALIADAFAEQVLTRFGACGEFLTDQGTEFLGEFSKLLERAGIVHRRTSLYHPQADGLAERMVQTLKKGIRAWVEGHNKRGWCKAVHWVAGGYRFSKQAALKDYLPFYLLLGREPSLPIDAPRVMLDVVIAGDAEKWGALAVVRAEYLKELLPNAMENLHVVQLRDARRYKQRQERERTGRGPALTPGREVYLRKKKQDVLDIGVGSERWRVKEVRESGVLVLEAEDGAEHKDHSSNGAVAQGMKLRSHPSSG